MNQALPYDHSTFQQTSPYCSIHLTNATPVADSNDHHHLSGLKPAGAESAAPRYLIMDYPPRLIPTTPKTPEVALTYLVLAPRESLCIDPSLSSLDYGWSH